jgi:hypothetical protein
MQDNQTDIEYSRSTFSLIWLVLRAYLELLRVDIWLARRGFPLLYDKVRTSPVRRNPSGARLAEDICHAVDLACVFYFKAVRCLQRSAAATTLLRASSIPAEMVIGVEPFPFRAHAWVEVGGRIVNDKPYTSEMYTVMDRC